MSQSVAPRPAAAAYAAAMERLSEDLALVEGAMREQLSSASEVLVARSAITCSPRAASACARRCCCSPPSCAATPARVGSTWPPRSSCCTPRRCCTTTSSTSRAAPRPPVRERALGQPPRRARGRLLLRARLVADRRGRRPRHPVDLRRHDPQHGRGRAAPAPAQLRSVGHRGALLPGDRAQERGAALRGVRVGRDPRRRDARRAAPARRVRPRARARVPAARRRARLRGPRGRISASARTATCARARSRCRSCSR